MKNHNATEPPPLTPAVGAQVQRGVRRWVNARLLARMIVDLGAIWAGAAAAYALSSGSVLAAIGGAAAIGFYGLWCFYDGSA